MLKFENPDRVVKLQIHTYWLGSHPCSALLQLCDWGQLFVYSCISFLICKMLVTAVLLSRSLHVKCVVCGRHEVSDLSVIIMLPQHYLKEQVIFFFSPFSSEVLGLGHRLLYPAKFVQ